MKKWSIYTLLLVAIAATWLKTDLLYVTAFDMDIENAMQWFILLINPLCFLLVVYGGALFFRSTKVQSCYILVVSVVLAFILYGNVMFYRFYNDFVTIPVLFQTSNLDGLGSSTLASMHIWDVLYFTDILVIFLVMKYLLKHGEARVLKVKISAYYVFAAAIYMLNLGLAEAERPQLLTRAFDREVLVKNIGTFNYHLYDAYVQTKSSAQRALANGDELVEVTNYIQANQAEPNAEMFGKYEGRNVIAVSLESLQSFVMNEEMNGEVITPFLNSLTADKDTYYFSDFYHQTGLGKTSDSEFIFENSLFGVNGGAVFFTHGGNTYDTFAESLGNNGYYTNVMHANNKSYWNRDMIYQSFNLDHFYDLESYEVTEETSVNWGLKDIPFFEQSADIMTEIPQPFYSRLITLTNHFPFYLDEEDMMIPEYTSNSGTLNRYFQTVRYLDESVKLFFEDLKERGLYDNSIIVMYGDHYGISETHNKAMAMYLEKDKMTAYDTALLQSVPLFIHIPGSNDGQEITKAAGQMDLRPTLLHLLGIDTTKDIQLGKDLFSEEHDGVVAFRDGRFVTDDYVYANEACYDRATGEKTDEAACEPYVEQSQQKLKYSDQIIYGDLLRFYDNEKGILLNETSPSSE